MASTPHDWRYPEPPAVATMKPLVKAGVPALKDLRKIDGTLTFEHGRFGLDLFKHE